MTVQDILNFLKYPLFVKQNCITWELTKFLGEVDDTMWYQVGFITIERLTSSPTYSGCGLKQEAADIPVISLDTQTNLYDNLAQLA